MVRNDTGTTTATSRPSNGLDRHLIVQAAIRSIDRNGTHGLTMRGLGEQLGVEGMALYRYVTGREDLLEAVISSLLDELSKGLDADHLKTWQGYLHAFAQAVRQIAVQHPAAFPLVATRHPGAPWLRPPLRSLQLVEDFLTTLHGYGFTDRQVVWIYRSFSSFLLGSLLLESADRSKREPTSRAGDGHVDLTDSPAVTRLRKLLSEDSSEEEFEATLLDLLRRLETTLPGDCDPSAADPPEHAYESSSGAIAPSPTEPIFSLVRGHQARLRPVRRPVR